MLVVVHHSVVSTSLQPRGLQEARLPCPLPSPRIWPSSCSLHWWCCLAISSSDTLFSFGPQSFPTSGNFSVSHLFPSDDHNIAASASASVLSVNIQGLSPLRSTGLISLLCKGLSGVFSSTTVWKHQFSSSLSAIRAVSSSYLKLLVFLLLTPICYSSSLAFLTMCSAYRLNKQGDSRQPYCTPFSILNQSVVPYRVLTAASWPTCKLLRRQVRWSGIPVSRRAFHSLSWSTQSKALPESMK